MNTKQTWWLTGVAIALFLFIVLVERRGEVRRDTREGGNELIPGLRLDLVRSVEIHEPGRPTLRFGRKGEFWMIESPVYYPSLVASWLSELERAKWVLRLSPEERGDGGLSAFGLEPPRARIVLEQEGGTTEIRVGSAIPVGKQLYVQVGGDEDVLVTDELIFAVMPESVNGWRMPTLFSYASQAGEDGSLDFGRIEIRGADNNRLALEPEVSTGGWRLRDPIDARADALIVSSLIYRIVPNWRVEEFVSDQPDIDLSSFGLEEPRLELAYMNGTNDVLSVQFGRSPTNRPELVYARQVQFTNVVLTAKTNISILELPHSYWRDRKLIALRTNDVNEVTGEYLYDQGVFSYRIERGASNTWQMVEPEPLPVDEELVGVFFQNMNAMPIQAFEKDVVSDFSEYGLETPARRFSFGVTTNAVREAGYPALSFGTNQNNRAFARRSDEIKVYAIDMEHFGLLPLAHWQWRDRDIWSFRTNEVKRVMIEQHGKRRELVRTPEARWLLAPGSSGVVDLSFEESVHQLSTLRADRWVARGGERSPEMFGFQDPPHRVTFELERNGVSETRSVAFGGLREDGNPFAAVVLEDGATWYLDFPAEQYYLHVRANFMLPEGG